MYIKYGYIYMGIIDMGENKRLIVSVCERIHVFVYLIKYMFGFYGFIYMPRSVYTCTCTFKCLFI